MSLYATPASTDESPDLVREQAAPLAEYLQAVRTQVEKPDCMVPVRHRTTTTTSM